MNHRSHLTSVLFCCAVLGLLQACATGLGPREVDDTELTAGAPASSLWQQMEQQRPDDWFRLLDTGEQALAWRLRAIDSATTSVDLQTFIWELDTMGSLLRDRLLAAAERGVQVRVLMDDSFTARADQALLMIDQHPGVAIRVYNPYGRRADQSAMRVLLNLGDFGRLDHRMHNKVLTVDRQVAIVGGRNMADHYFGLHEESNFRDMELLLGGDIADDLTASFDSYWNNAWSYPLGVLVEQDIGADATSATESGAVNRVGNQPAEPVADHTDAWMTMLASAQPGRARLLVDIPAGDDPDAEDQAPRQLGLELLQEIDRASDSLWLISAYLIPTAEMEAALRRAVDRGVAVRILTNSLSSNNHVSAHSAYQRHLRALLDMGVEVFEMRDDSARRDYYMVPPVDAKSLCLHAKLMIMDDERVFVGSANLDPRSLNLNTEVGLVIDSLEVNQRLRALLEPDFAEGNAWRLVLDDGGGMQWQSGDEVLKHPPSHTFMQRLEDWLLQHLPLEAEM